MEIREIQAIIEAVLFAAGDPVELERLADIVDVDKRSLREILKKMMDSYNYERRGIHIIRMEDSYQICTNGAYAEYISRLAEPPRKQNLSGAALEVLAIVAYKQPVTRSTIEHIRGVNCDYIVNRLIERNFIEETGRLDAPGRPILFGTTKHFMRSFGISELDELPEFDSLGESPEESSQIEMEEVAAYRQTEMGALIEEDKQEDDVQSPAEQEIIVNQEIIINKEKDTDVNSSIDDVKSNINSNMNKETTNTDIN